MSAGGSRKAILAAMAANGGIAISKFVAFLMTGASSMLAESIHSVADTSNQGLLLLGGARARRDASRTHQFGYGRERYFWSFVVALVLFSLGGLFALYEGIEKIRHPHEIESYGIAAGVLTLGLLLEGASFRTAIIESKAVKGTRSWWTFVRTARTPELPVVLLEDLGAMIGLVLALVGVSLAHWVDPIWDGIGTTSIGVLLAAIAVLLTIEMKSLLIGESATDEKAANLRTALLQTPGVERILNLRTQHLAPEEILVAGKVDIADTMNFREVTEVIDAAETAMRAAVPEATMIYLEPDEYDPAHVASPDRNDGDHAADDTAH